MDKLYQAPPFDLRRIAEAGRSQPRLLAEAIRTYQAWHLMTDEALCSHLGIESNKLAKLMICSWPKLSSTYTEATLIHWDYDYLDRLAEFIPCNRESMRSFILEMMPMHPDILLTQEKDDAALDLSADGSQIRASYDIWDHDHQHLLGGAPSIISYGAGAAYMVVHAQEWRQQVANLAGKVKDLELRLIIAQDAAKAATQRHLRGSEQQPEGEPQELVCSCKGDAKRMGTCPAHWMEAEI